MLPGVLWNWIHSPAVPCKGTWSPRVEYKQLSVGRTCDGPPHPHRLSYLPGMVLGSAGGSQPWSCWGLGQMEESGPPSRALEDAARTGPVPSRCQGTPNPSCPPEMPRHFLRPQGAVLPLAENIALQEGHLVNTWSA